MAPRSLPLQSSPESSHDDQHEEDVLNLVARLAALEFERGKLMAQIELHLRVRTAARQLLIAEEAPGVDSLQKGAAKSRVIKKQPGQLEREILEDLAKCGSLTTREMALHVEANEDSVRQTVLRLIRQAKIVREGRRRYRLVGTPGQGEA